MSRAESRGQRRKDINSQQLLPGRVGGLAGLKGNTINPDVSIKLSSSVTDTISSRQDPGPDQSQEQHLDEADRWQMMKAQLSTHWWQ